jgi:hypothetical protein
MKKNIRIGTCLAICLFSVCLIAGLAAIKINIDLNNSVEEISSELHIAPNVDIVRDYVYCELLVIGDTQPQIEENLRKIGAFSVYGDYFVKKYQFKNPDINYIIKELHLTYDKSWRLKKKGIAVGFGDYQKIKCTP